MALIPERERMDRRSLVGTRLGMLLRVHNKKINEKSFAELTRVYADVLDIYSQGIINAAFTKAEREFEKLPTPKRLSIVCNEMLPPQVLATRNVCRLCDPDGWITIPKPGPGDYRMAVRCTHFGEETYDV